MRIVLRHIKYWQYSHLQGTTSLAVTLLNPPLLSSLDEFKCISIGVTDSKYHVLTLHTYILNLFTNVCLLCHTFHILLLSSKSFYRLNYFCLQCFLYPFPVNLALFFHWLSHFISFCKKNYLKFQFSNPDKTRYSIMCYLLTYVAIYVTKNCPQPLCVSMYFTHTHTHTHFFT